MQVLLYAMEDFSFADFIHLAVYHKRDLFAASPVGISPRTWNPHGLIDSVLSTPHHKLSAPEFPARSLRASRASRHFRDGIRLGQDEARGNGRKGDESGEVSLMRVPEMEKWAKLLESGGNSNCSVPACFTQSAFL